MEQRALVKWGAALVAAAVVASATWALWPRASGEAAKPATVSRVVPEGVRIRVEVLNASDVRGLGRRATFYLRDAGFDVVKYSGTDERRDSSLVINRTGNAEWAQMASRALGGAAVRTELDSLRYVDLTVLIGARWLPQTQTFYP